MSRNCTFGIATFIAFSLLISQITYAQQTLNYVPSPTGSWSYSPWGNQSKFLWDNIDLMNQVEVTRDQRREFIELKLDFEEATNSLKKSIQKMQRTQYEMVDGKWKKKEGIADEIKEMQKELNDLTKEYKTKADNVLLPHQKELRSRAQLVKSLGGKKLEPLISRRLTQHLELTDEQQKRIDKIASAANRKLAEQVLRTFKDSEKEILKELTREQREKFEALFTDQSYQMPKKSRQSFWIYYYEAAFLKKQED